MKKILVLLSFLSMNTTFGHMVYQKSVASSAHDGQAVTTVLMNGNSVSIELENENGFSCYFDGIYNDKLDAYLPYEISTQKLTKRSKSCRVQVTYDINGTANVEALDKAKCSSFCGAGAEISAMGLQLIEE